MGMNDTPSAQRVHIGFFGRRNAGKSSIVNAVTGQEMALVSAVKGTTTDPVMKSMELLPMGPVVIVDTPGFDDSGELGEQRVRRTRQVLNSIDVAVLVTDAVTGLCDCDRELMKIFKEKDIPFVIACNKSDLLSGKPALPENGVLVSALTGDGIFELKERIAHLGNTEDNMSRLVGDLVKPGDFVVLVTPIDKAAPKARMILPEQQVIRGVVDAGGAAIDIREDRLTDTLAGLGRKPALVITDSQAFGSVSKQTPMDIPLTSFSILMARWKGSLKQSIQGVAAIRKLKDGDRVLISEGCTHHRQCTDIGTVKIPRWLQEYTGCSLSIETSSGHGFPEDLTPYALVIHCGACMLTEREVRYRMRCAADQNVPITNYGTAIAAMHGILPRALALFPDLEALIDQQAS